MRRGFKYGKKVWLLCWLLCHSALLLAQSGNLIRFSTADGLPSNNVYYVLEDSQGFLWFGTDAGVARFDGIDFEVYNRSDGLTSQDVFQMVEDRSGRIWFATFDGRPCFYQDGKIYNHKNTPWLGDVQTRDFIQFIHEDTKGTIWMGGKLGRVIEIVPEVYTRMYPSKIMMGVKEQDGRQFFINRWMDIAQLDRGVGDFILMDSSMMEPVLAMTPGHPMGYKLEMQDTPEAIVMLLINTDQVFAKVNCGGADTLARVVGLAGKTLVNLAKLADNKLAICYQGGISKLVFDSANCQFETQEILSLPGVLISHIQEVNGATWVTTLGDGILYLPQNTIRSVPLPGENPEVVDVFHNTAGTCLVSGHHNTYGTFRAGEISMVLDFESDLDYKIRFVEEDSLGVLAFNTRELLRIKPDLTNDRFIAATGIAPVYLPQREQLFSIANAWLLGFKVSNPITRLDSTVRIFILPIEEGRGKSLAKHNDSTLWAVTQAGMKEISIVLSESAEIRDLSNTYFNYEPLGVISSTFSSGVHCNWIWTDQEVLGILQSGDSLKLLNEVSLPDYTLRGLYHVNDSLLLAGTDEGLMVFQIDQLSGGFRFSRIISQTSGLAGAVVNGLDVYQDSVYVATDQGLSIFPQKYLTEPMLQEAPLPHIKELWANGVPLSVTAPAQVSGTSNSILIRHTGIHYASLGNITFRYRVNKGEWSQLNSQTVHFIDLPAGDYTYEVQARSAFGIWSSQPATAHFSVLRPFYATNWFYGLVILGLGLIIAGAVWLRFRQLKDKAKMDRRAAEMELRALKAQMNPHFIFNVLGSIQRYMLANNSKMANEYLTKFSRLTRMILNHSNKLLVSLSDELQAMDYYIALEQLRLSQRFTYSIQVDESVNPDRVEIPPLLLQVFVENAVWHGLSALEKDGRLELIFVRHQDLMKIVVRDNGIGRKAAMARNPRQGESRGSQIIIDKLYMLNETVYQGKATMNIIDLYDDSGNPRGTEVQFWVPLHVHS